MVSPFLLSPKETQRRPDTLLFTSVYKPPAFHMGVMPYKELLDKTHHRALNKSLYKVPLYLPMQGFKKSGHRRGFPGRESDCATLQSLPLVSSNRKFSIYIYIIYTPNLGLVIAVFDREREQGRFRGSSEGAGGAGREHRGSTEGASREH